MKVNFIMKFFAMVRRCFTLCIHCFLQKVRFKKAGKKFSKLFIQDECAKNTHGYAILKETAEALGNFSMLISEKVWRKYREEIKKVAYDKAYKEMEDK